MSWTVDVSLISDWLDEQGRDFLLPILDAVRLLESRGPALGRPLVDTIKGSRIKNLKELRPASPKGTEIRILFVFDPMRRAVMLMAGDKSSGKRSERWSEWYKNAIPRAERLYDEYLDETGGERA